MSRYVGDPVKKRTRNRKARPEASGSRTQRDKNVKREELERYTCPNLPTGGARYSQRKVEQASRTYSRRER